MKDTLRILLFWRCNLKCSYCCNNIPAIRKKIKQVSFNNIKFENYNNLCITGGEPFLRPFEVFDILRKTVNIPKINIFIYSNGMLLTKEYIKQIKMWYPHVQSINIGLHDPKTFGRLIRKFKKESLIRFDIQDIYKKEISNKYPNINVQYWKMNQCDTPNEDIIILKK